MNKTELIEAISAETNLSKKDVDAVIKSFTNVVSNTLQKKESVQLIGFGTFETAEREARTGRNPSTGEEIQIAASTVVKFKVGAGLKAKVNPPKPKAAEKSAKKKADKKTGKKNKKK
jgi:DNA-binding protein HU-beta